MFVPLTAVALFLLLGAVATPLATRRVAAAARMSSRRQAFIVETVSEMRLLKLDGAERTWVDRYRELSGEAAVAGYRTTQFMSIVSTLSYMIVIGAGLTTLGFGAELVLEGSVTVGALIACMILTWRALGPLQAAALTFTRLQQIGSSIKQIDTFVRIPTERNPSAEAAPIENITGLVTVTNVTLRYAPDRDPTLFGVTFQVQPGDIACIIGPTGSEIDATQAD